MAKLRLSHGVLRAHVSTGGRLVDPVASCDVPDDAEAAYDTLHGYPDGDPKQAKALLRLLITNLQINSRNEILPPYKIINPSVCAPTSSVVSTGRYTNQSFAAPALSVS